MHSLPTELSGKPNQSIGPGNWTLDSQIKSLMLYWLSSLGKAPCNQSYGFSSSHVWRWELDHKEGWALKNWCFPIVVLEMVLESPLDSKDIKPANPKGNQPWISIGRIDTEAEAPIIWPPNAKSQLTLKDPTHITGNDWSKRRREWQRMRWLDSIAYPMDINLSKLQEIVKDTKSGMLQSMRSQSVGHILATEQQQIKYRFN